jgi:pimeloyl-ACP methyl ester carboxylesterase
MIIERVEFFNNLGQRLVGKIQREKSASGTGVVFCHGLFSSKDGYKITRLAADIVGEGYTLLTFDFSFAGESEGDMSQFSVRQEVRDLECAIAFFRQRGIDRFHLMGSSMGGAVSLLHASKNPEGVLSLVLIATPADLEQLILANTGVTDVDSLPDGGMTPIDGIMIHNKFFRELRDARPGDAARSVGVPTLVIHGGLDQVVDVSSARLLEQRLAGEKRLVIIGDGDHHLTRESDMRVLSAEIAGWLQQHS